MTPLRFEALYLAEWDELDAALTLLARGHRAGAPVDSDRVAALYRRACEHLAIARARSYPAFLLERLERLTSSAHRIIYHRREFGLSQIRRLALVDFPSSVRAHAVYVWIAAAVFLLPALVVGSLVYSRPELVLSLLRAEQAASFDEMYSTAADAIGRRRDVHTDWMMFGFYIRNNIGVAFQCFAAGLFAGVGSLAMLAFNGALGGAVAGYLSARGMSSTFYSFVVTHAAFELTAIVLAGAAGLRIGHALVAPGRSSRVAALTRAAREASVLVAGVTAMLVIAAAVEAFWSSAAWIPPAVKYGVAAVCWTAVVGYLALQGRHAR